MGTWKEWSGCSHKVRTGCVRVQEGMVRTRWYRVDGGKEWQEEWDKGKERQITISTEGKEEDSIRNAAKRLGFARSRLHILRLRVQRWAYKLEVGRWDSRYFRFIRNGQMCSGMVLTALGMLTKQMLVQHPFGNATDEFGKAWDGFGFGQGLFR